MKVVYSKSPIDLERFTTNQCLTLQVLTSFDYIIIYEDIHLIFPFLLYPNYLLIYTYRLFSFPSFTSTSPFLYAPSPAPPRLLALSNRTFTFPSPLLRPSPSPRPATHPLSLPSSTSSNLQHYKTYPSSKSSTNTNNLPLLRILIHIDNLLYIYTNLLFLLLALNLPHHILDP